MLSIKSNEWLSIDLNYRKYASDPPPPPISETAQDIFVKCLSIHVQPACYMYVYIHPITIYLTCMHRYLKRSTCSLNINFWFIYESLWPDSILTKSFIPIVPITCITNNRPGAILYKRIFSIYVTFEIDI